jgi:hypothetical protein
VCQVSPRLASPAAAHAGVPRWRSSCILPASLQRSAGERTPRRRAFARGTPSRTLSGKGPVHSRYVGSV